MKVKLAHVEISVVFSAEDDNGEVLGYQRVPLEPVFGANWNKYSPQTAVKQAQQALEKEVREQEKQAEAPAEKPKAKK